MNEISNVIFIIWTAGINIPGITLRSIVIVSSEISVPVTVISYLVSGFKFVIANTPEEPVIQDMFDNNNYFNFTNDLQSIVPI